MIAYLRIVEGRESHVRYHQVWDAERFVQTQRSELAKQGVTIEVITEADYRAEKWPTAPGRAAA